MLFGTHVLVMRGGGPRPGTKGCRRVVSGILIGARGWQRRVRLTQDDPLSTIAEWSREGDVGWWDASALRPLADKE